MFFMVADVFSIGMVRMSGLLFADFEGAEHLCLNLNAGPELSGPALR